jgi:hypothetical protein
LRHYQAVASTFIDANVKEPAQREVLKAAINARLNERDKVGKVPNINIYDKSAPSQTTEAEHTRPAVERKTERTR